MRALLTRLMLAAAAVLAAVAIYVLLTAPAPAIEFDAPLPPGIVFGAYHVHSSRSDGAGSLDQVAEAAATAGISFVVLTDHGDATRAPQPPEYRQGVLLIDAVEVGTDGGHVVALGLGAASPYPLGGRPRDVVEDIQRQGGSAILAHPDSPDAGLRWRGNRGAYDGLEWLNADSEWRDESLGRLMATLVRSFVRPAESVVSVFERPDRTLQRWDVAARDRSVVGLAAVDAHGGLSTGDDEGRGGRRSVVSIPSYAAMFGTVWQGVVLDGPLTREPAGDAARVIGALRAGDTFSLVRAIGGPAHLEFQGSRAGETVRMGGRAAGGGTLELTARVPQAPGVTLAILHDGQPVASGRGSVALTASAPGAYRVEAAFPGARVPWIVSNPIYLGEEARGGLPAPPGSGGAIVPLPPDDRWTIEADGSSVGTVALAGESLVFDFRLGPGEPAGQYAALVAPVREQGGFDRLVFRAHASSPMRLSVQLRLPGGRDGLRWRRSVYIDTEPREIVVRLEDLEPVGGVTSQQPLVAPVQSVLFVVDTVNTAPGSSGRVELGGVGLGVGNVER